MPTLLLHIAGSRIYNFTLFRPHLYLYDDRVVYKKRHILTHDEFSIPYNHIAQANLINFIYLFAHVEIATTGMRFIKVHWVFKKKRGKPKRSSIKKYMNHTERIRLCLRTARKKAVPIQKTTKCP